ncbi:MAG: hypothetical protein HOE69_04650 [Euryarchaeota archaeon]|jgi:hypothetical protein|nr:hypothetical protein [Euryarchaeota archaeon]
MVDRTKASADAGDFFSSQTTFDLEENAKKKRRSRDGKKRSKPVSIGENDYQKSETNNSKLNHEEIPVQTDEITCCPGCGTKVEEGDFVDALISFATGAADYLEGDPVRTQAIQSLKQQAKSLQLPEPNEDWLLEICLKLELQVHRYIEARHDAIRKEMEEELRRELVGELYELIKQEIEVQIRQDVEREMWVQFEEMLRQQQNESE